jgi:hypothetical protein
VAGRFQVVNSSTSSKKHTVKCLSCNAEYPSLSKYEQHLGSRTQEVPKRSWFESISITFAGLDQAVIDDVGVQEQQEVRERAPCISRSRGSSSGKECKGRGSRKLCQTHLAAMSWQLLPDACAGEGRDFR